MSSQARATNGGIMNFHIGGSPLLPGLSKVEKAFFDRFAPDGVSLVFKLNFRLQKQF